MQPSTYTNQHKVQKINTTNIYMNDNCIIN